MPPTGYPMTLLPGRGIQRRLTLQNLAAVAGLLVAAARAVGLVGRLRPSVVVAVGGYASVAVGLAAVLWRVPLVVAEQNRAPGLANRLLARFAEGVGGQLPRHRRCRGPSSPATRSGPRSPPSTRPGPGGRQASLRRRRTPAARSSWSAGSLGRPADQPGRARGPAARGATAPTWPSTTSWAGATGRRSPRRRPTDRGRARAPGSWRTRTTCRRRSPPPTWPCAGAGSSTCFELAAAGLPASSCRRPVTADQQTGNARHLVDAGAAVLVPDAELDGARLVAEVDALLADPDRLAAMGAAARRWARPDAAADIAALAEEHARG